MAIFPPFGLIFPAFHSAEETRSGPTAQMSIILSSSSKFIVSIVSRGS